MSPLEKVVLQKSTFILQVNDLISYYNIVYSIFINFSIDEVHNKM